MYSQTQDPFSDEMKVEKIVEPFEVLKEIISTGIVLASGNQGFVKGTQKAVCLSEIPLSAVHHFAAAPSEKKARYRFYGIALSKKTIFNSGGRPVIYLPDNEADWIPNDHKWRHVRYEFGNVDFTHEREWRVPGDLDLTKAPGLYILVWSPTEAKQLYEMQSPLQKLIRGVLPMEHINQML